MRGDSVIKSIEILYSDGCPGWRRTVERVENVVRDMGLEASVRIDLVPVETDDDARRFRFLGSPTVRIEGRDVEAGAEDRTSFGLQCRLYPSGGGLNGVPDESLLRAALVGLMPGGGKPCP